MAVLQDFSGKDLREYACLDLGSATGVISSYLKSSFKSIVGVEANENLAKQAGKRADQAAIFVVADGGNTPFSSQSFDVIICTQVYEHMGNPGSLPGEIWRLLKPNGLCFFSGPNRWNVVEEHYSLPFLSWLPSPLANLYMRLTKRGTEYDVHPLFHWQLRSLFARFEIHDYTVRLIRQPDKFGVHSQGILQKIAKHLPVWFIKLFTLWLPNYNWVLSKRP